MGLAWMGWICLDSWCLYCDYFSSYVDDYNWQYGVLLSGGSVGATEHDSFGAQLFRLFFARWEMGWTVGACIVILAGATLLVFAISWSAVYSTKMGRMVRFSLI